MIGLTNGYVYNTLKNMLGLPGFHGVYSADVIPKSFFKKKKNYCIVNLSGVDDPGTHFVVLYVESPKRIVIYDSLALNPDLFFPELMRVIVGERRRRRRVAFPLNRPIQDAGSAFCGYFSIYFSMLLSGAFPDERGVKKFKKRKLSDNDDIVIHNIDRLIKNNTG